jgi:hypothetical protein
VTALATDRFNAAVTAMIGHLNTFLPPDGVPPRPASLTVLEAAERPVGVGNVQGNVERGPLAVLGVRGGRVQARVRFDLRAGTPQDAAIAVQQLQLKVRAARLDPLLPWIHDFLVLEPDGSDPAALIGTDDWRQSVLYRVLYEYRYEDPEESGSLIVRVRMDLRGEHHEDDAVTRDLARWDREDAPPLVLRGPRTVGRLTMLEFTGGGVPAGQVTVRRTFDGAPPAAGTASLADFAAAVLPPAGGRNHERLLGGVADLLSAFAPAGKAVRLARLGNLPDTDGVPEDFVPRALDALRGLRLETPADRLEIRYQGPAAETQFPGGAGAVVYLGTERGPFS